MEPLSSVFNRHFNVRIANSLELNQLAYSLRYQVYCREHGYEDGSQFPNELEQDQYDDFSVQGLVYHKGFYTRSEEYAAGVVRLVLAGAPARALPIDECCGELIKFTAQKKLGLCRANAAEISRLAVSKEFKRRMCERFFVSGIDEKTIYTDGEGSAYVRRMFPHIILGLFSAVVRMSAEQGVDHWYALMEPTLLRLLGRFGIFFQNLGPTVEHRGKRQPVIGVIDDVLEGIYQHRRDVWEVITDNGAIWPRRHHCYPLTRSTERGISLR